MNRQCDLPGRNRHREGGVGECEHSSPFPIYELTESVVVQFRPPLVWSFPRITILRLNDALMLHSTSSVELKPSHRHVFDI